MTAPKSGGFRWRAMKPRASRDCSKGGSTATMSSTTASLIARCSLLMQPRPLEQLGAVDRGQRHVNASGPERPEFSVEGALTRNPFAVHREDNVAGLELGAGGRPLRGDADHHHPVVDLR